MKKFLKKTAFSLLPFFCAAGLFALLDGGTGGRRAAGRVVRFSFLEQLPRCRVRGIEKANPEIALFKKRHPIKNANRYPAHLGPVNDLNWQAGFLVSRRKKQVETRASLLCPAGVVVRSPLLKFSGEAVFRAHVAVAGRGGAVFRLKVLGDAGELLHTVSISNRSGEGWKTFRFPLNTPGGKGYLVLSADCVSGAFPLWGEPVVSASGKRSGPNVLIIMVDAMRGDVMGVNGSGLGLTPNIDRYASGGVSFTRCFANANWTRPSELSMFTGLYPRRLRINQLDFPVSAAERNFFYKNIRTLPDLFRKNGYRTRGIINNIFLQTFTGTGVDIGFDHVSDFRTINRDTRDITREALKWADANRNSSWFMFCNYNTPHKPYSAPERFFRQIKDDPKWRFERRVKEYLAEVAFADHWIGKLLDGLKRMGSLTNTIVVINADHGEVLWPWHNYSTVYSDYTRFGHSLTMLDEELHVPLIIFGPGIRRGGTNATLVQLVDLFPTLTDLAGLKRQGKIDGRSLAGLLSQGKKPAERPVYAQGLMLEAVRTSRYKYVWRPPGFDRIGIMGKKPHRRVPEELYDLKTDPGERRNIIRQQPEVAARLRKLALERGDSRVKNNFICKWPEGVGYLSGEIVTEGAFFRCPKLPGGHGRLSSDGRRFRFQVKRGKAEDFRFSFQVHPDFAPVSLSLRYNGIPVPAQRIYLGKTGFPGKGRSAVLRSDGDFRMAVCRDLPLPLARGERGSFLFREPGRLSIRYSSDTTRLSTEIKTVLRDWGYIQK